MSKRWLVFIVFASAYLLSHFFRGSNAVIAGDLSRDLDLSAAQLGLMTSLFFATFALAQLPLGSALDRYGARRVTAIIMLVTVMGALIFATAQSFVQLALGRALIGLGTAANLMGALKSFSTHFTPPQFVMVSSLYLMVGSSGALMAATPLALLNAEYGWRVIFVGGSLMFLLAAGLIWFLAQDKAPSADNEVSQGSFYDIFSSLRFWRIGLLNFSLVGTLLAFQGLWAGPFLRDTLGLSAVATGNLLLVLAISTTLSYLLMGYLGRVVGLAKILSVAAFMLFVVQLLLVFVRDSWSLPLVALLLAFYGLAASAGILTFSQVRNSFPDYLTGRAVTAINLFGFAGGFLLQWLLGVIIGSFGVSAAPYPAVAYSTCFAVMAVISLATALNYLPLLRETD